MPRFSEKEKEQIRERLFVEGERLFTAHGLKKVTIDELVNAVHIAKASFYVFYENKEYLYLDIVQSVQQQIFTGLEELLKSSIGLPGRERVREVFASMYGLLAEHPVLARIDSETAELVSRKVTKERMDVFAQQNTDAVDLLCRHGVKLTCTPQVASLAFRALYCGWLSLQDNEAGVREAASELLLNGVLERVVCEE